MKKLILTTAFLALVTGATYAQEADEESVCELYVATFDRAPEAEGLNYWVDSNLTLEEIAQSFFDQNETQEKYPQGLDDVDFVEEVYGNTFDRAGDDKGVEYWRAALNDGNVTKAQFILAVLNGALGDDAELLKNKKDVGLAFADSNSTDIDLSKELMVDISAERGSMLGSLNKLYAHLKNGNSHAFENNYYIDDNGTIVSKDKSMKDIPIKSRKEDKGNLQPKPSKTDEPAAGKPDESEASKPEASKPDESEAGKPEASKPDKSEAGKPEASKPAPSESAPSEPISPSPSF